MGDFEFKLHESDDDIFPDVEENSNIECHTSKRDKCSDKHAFEIENKAVSSYQNQLEEGELLLTEEMKYGAHKKTTSRDIEPFWNRLHKTKSSEPSCYKCGITYQHINREINPQYDVYIGGETSSHCASIWENPFKWTSYKSTVNMLQRYEDYIRANKDLLAKIPQLQNKTLACW
jgi:hypothetical protein